MHAIGCAITSNERYVRSISSVRFTNIYFNLNARLSQNSAEEEERKMQTATSRVESRTTDNRGIVYRTVCRNPGCGFRFDLRVTPDNASLLGGSMTCPHCKRHGGQLKSQGRIGKQLFAAKLLFRPIGVGPDRSNDEMGADSRN